MTTIKAYFSNNAENFFLFSKKGREGILIPPASSHLPTCFENFMFPFKKVLALTLKFAAEYIGLSLDRM